MTLPPADTAPLEHFISLTDATDPQLRAVFDAAYALRNQRDAGQANAPLLAGLTACLIFEKPSLRTRVSFEQAVRELGGQCISLTGDEVGLGQREPVEDVARVLEGMVHCVIARVFEHEKLLSFARAAKLPVVNALSDFSHPCQALADAMTMMDAFGRDLSGRTVAFVGDGNNVARSLAICCGRFGMNFILASPPGYELEQTFIDQVMAKAPGMNFELTRDPAAALAYADAVYTDTWVSMGQEGEAEQRLHAFAPFQLNPELMSRAPDHAIVLHCLPAHHGWEITDEVLDGPHSRVFQQAHNRLHAQKGLLAVMLGRGPALAELLAG